MVELVGVMTKSASTKLGISCQLVPFQGSLEAWSCLMEQ